MTLVMIFSLQENKSVYHPRGRALLLIGFLNSLHQPLVTNACLYPRLLSFFTILPFSFNLFTHIHPPPTPFQTKLLTQYILNLGKYDQNYDIRDRTRFIRQLIVPNEKSGTLNKYARRILLAPKPAPVLESTFKGSSYICDINLLSLFETY